MNSLGQFYTTNFQYILDGIIIPNKLIKYSSGFIEPFCGLGTLLDFIPPEMKKDKTIEKYDIEPKCDGCIKQDTLINVPNYKNKFIITNPPFLAKNKSKSKKIFNEYKLDDLYKCFIKSFLSESNDGSEGLPIGGILILPINFFCANRIADVNLRKLFLEKYRVIRLNIFEEQVFQDTSYSVCSFLFIRKINLRKESREVPIKTIIYPQKKIIKLVIDAKNKYIIGSELLNISINDDYSISRLIEDVKCDKKTITRLLLNAIDSGDINKISLQFTNDKPYYGKISARTYATILINPSINIKKQKKIKERFNLLLNKWRLKYNSLFLTNYREGNRKRITFRFAYRIIGHILIDI